MRLRKSGRLYLPQQGESRFLPLSAPVVSLRNSLAQGPRHVPAAALSPPRTFSTALRPQGPYGLLGARSRGCPPRLSHGSATTGSSSVFLHVHRDSTDCWGQGAHDVHLDFHTALPRLAQVQYFFTSTETVRTVGDKEPMMSTSTFTRLCHDWLKFSVTLRPQRQYGLLGTRSP